MQPDPTIERIRHIRHEISEQCSHNPKKLIEYYRKYQQKFSGRFIRKPKIGRVVSSNNANAAERQKAAAR